MELTPHTASVVFDINRYQWHDQAWLSFRREQQWTERPIAIYEVHLGSWMRSWDEGNRVLNYRELAVKLVEYVQEMGYTHLELLPITEHPFTGSWGYQCSGYFAPTSRYGTPDDFMFFVDYCHANGVGVILDWVPAHFPTDAHALGRFDGTCLYEHEDPRKGFHMDWGTLIFNYGRNEVRDFLITNALFWFEKYHIDGMRIDAVASMLHLDYSRKPGEWIPNKYGGRENLEAVAFVRELNDVIHGYFPEALIMAEESTSWPQVTGPTYLGGLGFSGKWNMGWMNDILQYMKKDCIYRKYVHNTLTFGIFYAFTEKFILPFSHDEVVHGKGSLINKMPGDTWQKFANLRLLLGFMIGHPGKKLLFMGIDIAQFREWNHDSSLDWHLLQYDQHRRLHQYVKDLLHLYRAQPSLHEVDDHYWGFQWLDFGDWEQSIIAFCRKAKDDEDVLVVVCNFTPVPRPAYRIGVPLPGFYREVINSDSRIYGGSNVGNGGGVLALDYPYHDQPYSLWLNLPPLGVIILQPPKPAKVVLPEPEAALTLIDVSSGIPAPTAPEQTPTPLAVEPSEVMVAPKGPIRPKEAEIASPKPAETNPVGARKSIKKGKKGSKSVNDPGNSKK
jgi:1,4-alpha-glucan branching enzyme